MDEAGFWSKVDKNGPIMRTEFGPCWIWTAGTHGRGYGQLSLNGRHFGAHRLGWELANGPVPPGRSVLHRCDNPPCVNPAHLFLGDDGDNARDRDSKKRDRNSRHPETIPRGEDAGRAKLTDEQVIELRALYAAGASSYELGGRFGVDPASAWLAATGRSWTHLPMPESRSGRRTGPLHHRAKLDADKVREIRARAAVGEKQRDLAAAFDVPQSSIWSVVHRKTWAHVD